MRNLLSIIFVSLLLSGNANAGVNEPGVTSIAGCDSGLKSQNKKFIKKHLKKLSKKNENSVLYASCDYENYSWAVNKGKDLEKLHKKTYKQCTKYARKHTGKECYLYAVNDEIVWKYDKAKASTIAKTKIADAKKLLEKQKELDMKRGRFFKDQPDVNDDYQIHFIYLISQDGKDREWDINGKMQKYLIEMNEIMLRETAKKSKGEGQKYKFDYRKDGNLDITFVRLSKNLKDLHKYRNQNIAPFLWMNKFNNPKKIYYTFADMKSVDGGEAGVHMGSTYLGSKHNNSKQQVIKITLHELHHAQGGGFNCVPGMSNTNAHWKNRDQNNQLGHGLALGKTYIHEEEGCPQLIDSVYLTPTSKDPYDPFKLICLNKWGKYNHPKLVKAREKQASDLRNGKWNYTNGGSGCKFSYWDQMSGMKLFDDQQALKAYNIKKDNH